MLTSCCASGKRPFARAVVQNVTTTMTTSAKRPSTTRLYIASGVLAVMAAGCSTCNKRPEEHSRPLTPGAIVPIPASRAAYITNTASDSISVIDRDGVDVPTVAVDLEADAHEAPHHLAVDSARNLAFVALAYPPPINRKKDPHASHGHASEIGKLARLDLGTLSVVRAVDVDENPGD